MTYNVTTQLFSETLTNTNYLNADWLIPLILIVITLAMITRRISDWVTLSFPISIMYSALGLRVHLLILTFTAVMFAVRVLSTELLTQAVSYVGNIFKNTRKYYSDTQTVYNAQREQISEAINTASAQPSVQELINEGVTQANRTRGLTKSAKTLFRKKRDEGYSRKDSWELVGEELGFDKKKFREKEHFKVKPRDE